MRISSLRYDNSRRGFSEVQENVVSTLNRKILTCVVLVGWLNMLSRGIWAGNEKIYSIVLLWLSVTNCFNPTPRLYYNQSRHQLFREWIMLCRIVWHIPLKRTEKTEQRENNCCKYTVFKIWINKKPERAPEFFTPIKYISEHAQHFGPFNRPKQEPITRTEQLPYWAYVTAFLQTSLFLDTF